MKNWRIFWVCYTHEHVDGYYHHWHNFLTGAREQVFAGYKKSAMYKKYTTFLIALSMLDCKVDDDYEELQKERG